MEVLICPFCMSVESMSICSRPFLIDEPNVEIYFCWNCDKEFVLLELSELENILKARK